MQIAGHGRFDLQRTHVAIEVDLDIVRIAEAVLTGQRLRDASGNLLRGDRAACAHDDYVGKPAGVDADELMRSDGIDDAVGRDGTRGAEVGRTENRHVGNRPGIVDEIADAHDVASHGDVCLEYRRRRLCHGGAAQREHDGEDCDRNARH